MEWLAFDWIFVFLPLIVGSVTDLSQHKYFGKKKNMIMYLYIVYVGVFLGGAGAVVRDIL